MTDGGTKAGGRDWVGRTLKGRYLVESVLGAGGMGTVYLAHDRDMDRKVVVKVPHARLLDDEQFRARFAKEIRSLTQVSQAHVVRALDAGEEEDGGLVVDAPPTPFAVLEYLEGGSLKDRLERGPESPEDVLGWLPDVAKALDFIHGQGVVHRDVKPGNILFDRAGNAVVADFGIAKALGTLDTGLTRTGFTPGSPPYMGPEVGMGLPLGPGYDEYALGVLVYEALSSALPHEGTSGEVLIARKAFVEPIDLESKAAHVPPAARAAVMKAVARKPGDRFPTCVAFAKAYGDGLVSRGPTEGERARERVTAVTSRVAAEPTPRSRIAERQDRTVPPPGPAPRPRKVLYLALGLLAALGGWFAIARPLLRSSAPTATGETARRDPPRVPAEPEPRAEVSASPAMAVEPAMEPPPVPVPAAMEAALPAWKAIVDRADAKAGENDWAAASQLLADARRAGAADQDLPRSLLGGVTRYLAPPVLTVIDPAEGARLKGTTVHVSGTLTSNRSTDMVELNGQVVLALKNGRFETDWNGLDVGSNTFEFRVVDGEEERAKVVRHFTGEARTEVYAAFLSGFAVAVGTEIDSATGYPKKIRRLKDDGEMVLIPAGTFQMGAVPGDSNAAGDEKPRHAVTLSKAYYLDVNEVTVGQWKKFVSGGGGRMPTDLRSEATDRHPIHNVDHTEMTAFAKWAGGSLPTEAQWERAAKGGHDDFVYPWGATDDVKKRNGAGSEDGFDGLAPVRSFPPNDYGLYDMSGNVWEWCSDWYDSSYYATSPSRDPSGPGSGSARAARGGSWFIIDDNLRASYRGSYDPAARYVNLGFRLARSL